MPPFGVTIPATVPQRFQIKEELKNYPILLAITMKMDEFLLHNGFIVVIYSHKSKCYLPEME
jgi:hypothetical protein